MTPKEKANDFIKKFGYYVNGYVGSSMLTNTEYPEQILKNAKELSIIVIDEILKNFDDLNKPEYCAFDATNERKFTFEGEYDTHMTGYDMIEFWNQVKSEIELL
jgi:hypothetical protein